MQQSGIEADVMTRTRVGVLVVAYNAATTLTATLDRLPEEFAARVDHVMVCDDASQDGTFEIGLAYLERSRLPMTVVRRPENLGYGGNQKAGYRWAMEHGLDVVVLLHADGQYAPEVIESIVEPIIAGEADAVFGSRMLLAGQARAGGMPLYKYAGNRILTTMQNRLTGLELSEWHSGYRAYRLAALRDIDLDALSDGFDFDTEIILQLHRAGRRMAEVPIPTYYGDEICYVNGMKYAKDVTADVLRYKARSMGFGRDTVPGRQPLRSTDTDAYQLKPSPHSSHGRLLDWLAAVPPGRVLDVGCSEGHFAGQARALGHRVDGIDVVEHDDVRANVDHFARADLTAGLPAGTPDYDVIVAADVLEHVVEPELLLTDLACHLRPGGTILISVPNFGHWYPRFKVTLGRFDYDERGPLDRGHVRFFTRRSLERMIEDCGLRIRRRTVVGSPVDVLERGGPAPAGRTIRAAAAVDRMATRTWPTLFGYQFLYQLEAN